MTLFPGFAFRWILRRFVLLLDLTLAVALVGCTADEGSQAEAPGSPESPDPSPSVEDSIQRQAYFGDLHVHSAWSYDAFLYSVRATPDDAYQFGQGHAITHVSGQEIQLERPLDFMAVTEHAEYMGVGSLALDPKHPLSKNEVARRFIARNLADAAATDAFLNASITAGEPLPELVDVKVTDSVWQAVIGSAERHYQPGTFTTFVGFEWTATPLLANSGLGRNLHRNVIFRGRQVAAAPFTSFDSLDPRLLWRWMDEQREAGNELLAIPHNPNLSDGAMYALTDSSGSPLDRTYAESRLRNEPVNEVVQTKGQSMSHPTLSPDDDYSGFEQFEFLLGNLQDGEQPRLSRPHGSYAREAFKDGLRLQASLGINPFQFGVIGSTDAHNAAMPVREDQYFGVLGSLDGTPQDRLGAEDPALGHLVQSLSAAGLAGVWADANTREAIFDALVRKETFATSGPRIRVRFFGGWDYSPRLFEATAWVDVAYQRGVAMGARLPVSPGRGGAPVFALWAVKDPLGGRLDRVQIIKGWLDGDETHERVYDAVVTSHERGAEELRTVWVDPDFNPYRHAFYYVRVLQIPTRRWSTVDAERLGMAPPNDVPAMIQERAWSSPIWYQP